MDGGWVLRMSGYKTFPNTTKFIDSLPMLLANDESGATLNSGSTFPADGLKEGMPCWRTDLKQFFIFDGQSWRLLIDLSNIPIGNEELTSVKNEIIAVCDEIV